MILAIDTAGRTGRVIFLTDDQEEILAEKSWQEEYSQSRRTLTAIARLMADNGWRKDQIKAVIFNKGPNSDSGEEASFTGLKISAAIANTFGFVLKIPIVGVSLYGRSFLTSIKKTRIARTTEFVWPIYPKNPNITFPK